MSHSIITCISHQSNVGTKNIQTNGENFKIQISVKFKAFTYFVKPRAGHSRDHLLSKR